MERGATEGAELFRGAEHAALHKATYRVLLMTGSWTDTNALAGSCHGP